MPVIIDYERQAREFLIKESHENLHDRVSRAYGILRTAQTISSEETMHLLSSVRMGVNLGLIRDLEIPTVNELFIHTQPAHLQKLTGGELDTADRNIERARYLRRHLQKRRTGRRRGEELSRKPTGSADSRSSPLHAIADVRRDLRADVGNDLPRHEAGQHVVVGAPARSA